MSPRARSLFHPTDYHNHHSSPFPSLNVHPTNRRFPFRLARHTPTLLRWVGGTASRSVRTATWHIPHHLATRRSPPAGDLCPNLHRRVTRDRWLLQTGHTRQKSLHIDQWQKVSRF